MPQSQGISRRRFLAAGAALGAGAIALGKLGGVAAAGSSTVALRKDGSAREMVGQAIADLGGIDSLIPAGSKVAIKVNGSWNGFSANTDPEVVREVVRIIRSRGPAEVIVYDHTINRGGWSRIASAAESAGAEVRELRSSSGDYVKRNLTGVGLSSARIARILDGADVLVNVPKLKTHGSAQVSIGLKNHLGSVLDRGEIHGGGGRGLQQGIADLNTCDAIRSKQVLVVCDAINPMVRGGPGSGTHAEFRGILAGVDPVATDYVGSQVIRRFNPSLPEVPLHIAMAAQLGLGTADPGRIQLLEAAAGTPISEDMHLLAGAAAGILALRARGRSGFSRAPA